MGKVTRPLGFGQDDAQAACVFEESRRRAPGGRTALAPVAVLPVATLAALGGGPIACSEFPQVVAIHGSIVAVRRRLTV